MDRANVQMRWVHSNESNRDEEVKIACTNNHIKTLRTRKEINKLRQKNTENKSKKERKKEKKFENTQNI